MIVQDITSRLFHIKGEANLETAFSKDEDAAPKPVKNGRCLYLVRLELAPQGHPELTEDRFELSVFTGWYDVYSRAGRRYGHPITFEELTKNPVMFQVRAKEKAPPLIREALNDVFGNMVYNANVKVLSEFDGHWEAFQNRFDEMRTYSPVAIQSLREVAGRL